MATISSADIIGTKQQLGIGIPEKNVAPTISGTGVVWTNLYNNHLDLYYQNVSITGGTPRDLTNTSNEDEFLGDIDNSNIAFIQINTYGIHSILIYNLTTDKISNIASGTGTLDFDSPAIRGDKYIVFS